MNNLVGWKSGTPDTRRMVTVLREFNDGSKGKWKCFYDGWSWVTYDGIYISGILGWREVK